MPHILREFPCHLFYKRFVNMQANVGFQLLLFHHTCAFGKCKCTGSYKSSIPPHLFQAHKDGKQPLGDNVWAAKGKHTIW